MEADILVGDLDPSWERQLFGKDNFLGAYLATHCKVWRISGMQSIFSTFLCSWQQRWSLLLSLLQPLVSTWKLVLIGCDILQQGRMEAGKATRCWSVVWWSSRTTVLPSMADTTLLSGQSVCLPQVSVRCSFTFVHCLLCRYMINVTRPYYLGKTIFGGHISRPTVKCGEYDKVMTKGR